MMKMKPIRLIFQEDCFDPEIMGVMFKERLKVEQSGVCIYETYQRKENVKFEKISNEKKIISEEEVLDFFEKVENHIEKSTVGGMIVDDCSAYVKLKYPGVEVLAQRELVDENGVSLDCVIWKFIERVFPND